MPRKAPTPCRHPGCPAVLEVSGYCDKHRAAMHRDYDRTRRHEPERAFYKSLAWQRTRAAFLRAHPLCCACEAKGLVVAARAVDHIQPIKSGGDRLDWRNLQALCIACHNRKTTSEWQSRRHTTP